MFWQHQFYWRTLGPQIRRCFIRNSFSQHFPAWKNMYSWPVISCWAKWGLVMGQKCTAGNVKLCEERFNWKFSTETKSTNMLSFTSLLIVWESSGNSKNRTRNMSSVWHDVVWQRSQDSKENLLQVLVQVLICVHAVIAFNKAFLFLPKRCNFNQKSQCAAGRTFYWTNINEAKIAPHNKY